MDPIEWMNYDLFGNSLLGWASGSLLFFFVWALLGLMRRLLRQRLQARAAGRDVMALQIAAHVVDQTRGWFLFLTALFAGSRL